MLAYVTWAKLAFGVCRASCRCGLSSDGPRQYAHCDMVLFGALILGGSLALLLRFRKEKDKQHNEAIAQIPSAVSMRVIAIFHQLATIRVILCNKQRQRH
jgi:hypothetical protein